MRRGRRRGQALVEFALVLPVLLVILLGTVDAGRLIFAYNSVSNAAREGGRTAIVNQTPSRCSTRRRASHGPGHSVHRSRGLSSAEGRRRSQRGPASSFVTGMRRARALAQRHKLDAPRWSRSNGSTEQSRQSLATCLDQCLFRQQHANLSRRSASASSRGVSTMITRGRKMKQNRGREAGQTVLVAALAMVPLLIMVGLIVDGGFALANQRRNQNSVDAAANAGAVLLMENLPFGLTGQPQPRTDADVRAQRHDGTPMAWMPPRSSCTTPTSKARGLILRSRLEASVPCRLQPLHMALRRRVDDLRDVLRGNCRIRKPDDGRPGDRGDGNGAGNLLGNRGLRLHPSDLPHVVDELRRTEHQHGVRAGPIRSSTDRSPPMR